MQGYTKVIHQWLICIGIRLHFRIAFARSAIPWTFGLQPVKKANRKVTPPVQDTDLLIERFVDVTFEVEVVSPPVDQCDVTLWAFSTGK